MKGLKLKLLIVFALVLFVGAPVALADWDPGDGHKMLNGPQEPDPTGWDVCLAHTWFVADDFFCGENGPITDIHFWISYSGYDNDIPIDPCALEVGICGDDPFGLPDTDNWLWYWNSWGGYGPLNINIRYYGSGLQGWHCPVTQKWLPEDHTSFFQVNITEIPDPAMQVAGGHYWLVLWALTPEPSLIGWKTSMTMNGAPAVWTPSYPCDWMPLDLGGDLAFVITGGEPTEPLEFGDAPESDPCAMVMAVAYPSLGVPGFFPTCKTIGPLGWIQHNNFAGYFGPTFDFEADGNAGLCPPPSCFPLYDQDECFNDGDAGLLFPPSYTISPAIAVVPCDPSQTGSLGTVCTNAVWGVNVDIDVTNAAIGYVNVLMDWDHSGEWSGSSDCVQPGDAPEHVLVNWPVLLPYSGPLSGTPLLGPPPPFLIGPESGYVWTRFTFTEVPVPLPWTGEGSFEDGETEDYLLLIEEEPPELDFGDAPDPCYPTLLPLGANHVIVPGYSLGASVDAELDGQPDPCALGDDNDGNDDEDGVVFTTPLIPGQVATVDVTVGLFPAFLNAWIDFNGDGDWADPCEQIFNDEIVFSGLSSLQFQVPASAAGNIDTFARFRLSTAGGLQPTGPAPDGEVEDYKVHIEQERFISASGRMYH